MADALHLDADHLRSFCEIALAGQPVLIRVFEYDARGTSASAGGRCCGPRDIEDARQHGAAGQQAQALVAAAHAPRLPAREHQPRDLAGLGGPGRLARLRPARDLGQEAAHAHAQRRIGQILDAG